MKTQLTDLLTAVNQIVESFSEIEDELPPNVYNIFAKPLGKMVENMGNVVAESENFNAIMRIITLVQKDPRVKIDVTRLERWEAFIAAERLPEMDVAYEPLNMPTAAEARPVLAMPAAPPPRVRIRPEDPWRIEPTTVNEWPQGFNGETMTQAIARPARTITVEELAARRAEFEEAELFADMVETRNHIQAFVNVTTP